MARQYETLADKSKRLIYAVAMGWVLLVVLGVAGKLMWRVFMLGWRLV